MFSLASRASGGCRGSEIFFFKKKRHFCLFQRHESRFGGGTEHSLGGGGGSRMRQCARVQFHRNAWLAILRDLLHVQCGSSSAPPLSKRTARNSVNVSDQARPVYYLPWFRTARSGSGSAAITSSREGPRDSDWPAATAARSSLLSAPMTGASVPT